MKYLLLKFLSLFYGLAVAIRNELFDLKILSSRDFELPVISIGNITAGGTGKTPHTEYIAALLKKEFRVATLSRGYKRKTRGFQVVEMNSTVKQVGDEPLQIKLKNEDIQVVVDANRVRGIEKLLSQPTKPDVILLDDAYQHRYVDPGINILLTDYNRLITKDSLLPCGRLRESASNKDRATIIIVTKCPDRMKPIDERIITKELGIRPYQNLYFSRQEYGSLTPVYPDECTAHNELAKGVNVLLFTGIANPVHLADYLKQRTKEVQQLAFPDHYQFKQRDLERILAGFNELKGDKKILVTTEKDMLRIRQMGKVPLMIKQHLFYIPLKISFHNNAGKDFDRKLLEYVRENKSNRELYTKRF